MQFCSLDNAEEVTAEDSKGNADGLEGVRDLPHVMVKLWRAGLFPSLRSSTQVCGMLDPLMTAPGAKRKL